MQEVRRLLKECPCCKNIFYPRKTFLYHMASAGMNKALNMCGDCVARQSRHSDIFEKANSSSSAMSRCVRKGLRIEDFYYDNLKDANVKS